jgi:sialic acid synthase SpsE
MMTLEASETNIARNLGAESGVMVIAEMVQGHDGSLEMAHAYIDASPMPVPMR